MTSTILLIIIGLIGLAVILTVSGMTAAEIAILRAERTWSQSRRHRRPLVSIIADDDISEKCLRSVHQNTDYRIEILYPDESPKGDFVLLLKRGVTLPSSLVADTLRQLADNTSIGTVEIVPTPAPPTTLKKLFSLYHTALLLPYGPVKSYFRAQSSKSRWPVMFRRTQPRQNKLLVRLYPLFRWCVQVANTSLLLYILYLSVAVAEPFYILMYLLCWLFWLVLSITTYSRFSHRQKITYILLAPVSLPYLLAMAAIAPLRPVIDFLQTIRATPSYSKPA